MADAAEAGDGVAKDLKASVIEYEEEKHIERVLYTQEELQEAASMLGHQISEDFDGKPLTVIGVATGAFMFLADLVRAMRCPMALDFIRASSYGAGTESSGAVQLDGKLKVPVAGRHVLVVEDIIDTGITLSLLLAHIRSLGPLSVSVCALLDKKERRRVEVEPWGSAGKIYTGFVCPNLFVVGYGMDFAEKYRSLPYVGVLKPEHYS